MLLYAQNKELELDEQDVIIEKLSNGKKLVRAEVKFLLSLIGFKDNVLEHILGPNLFLAIYKKHKAWLEQSLQGLDGQDRIDFVEQQIEKELMSDSGLPILKYAAYLKLLNRRLLLTDLVEEEEYSFWDVRKTKVEEDSQLLRGVSSIPDIFELAEQTGALENSVLAVFKEWKPLPAEVSGQEEEIHIKVRNLVYGEYKLGEISMNKHNENKDTQDFFDGFVLSNLHQIFIRKDKEVKKEGGIKKGTAYISSQPPEEAGKLYSIMNKVYFNKNWTHSEFKELVAFLTNDKVFDEAQFLSRYLEQKIRYSFNRLKKSHDISDFRNKAMVESEFNRLLKDKGLLLSDVAAHLRLLNRMLVLVKSDRLGFVFYQIPIPRKLEEYEDGFFSISFLKCNLF